MPGIKGKTGVYLRTAFHRKRISDSKIGHKTSQETKDKISQTKLKNPSTRYNVIHTWLGNRFGKASRCENLACAYPRKPKLFQYALLAGKKYEHKRDNFVMLCPSCHRKYDLGLIQLELKLTI